MQHKPEGPKNMRATVRDVTADEFAAYVKQRGYKTNLLNGGGGFELIGPRKNRKVVLAHPNGLFPLDSAALWCDCVEYATIAIETKKLRKKGLV